MKIKLTLLSALLLIACKSNAQNRIDSIATNYMMVKGDLDTVIFNKKKYTNGKIKITTNYSLIILSTLSTKIGKLELYQFSGSSEYGSHLLIIQKNNHEKYVILSKSNIESDLVILTNFFKEYPTFPERDKILIYKNILKWY